MMDWLKMAGLAGLGAATGGFGLLGPAAASGAAASTVPIAEGVFAGATPAGLIAANGGGAAAGSSMGGSGLLGSGLQALNAASAAKGLLSTPQQQVQPGQLPQANNGINDALQQRMQQYQQYMQNRKMG